MADKTKSAFIISAFKDDNFNGSGERRDFVKGKTETLPEGVFINYEAAGLVRETGNADDKATKTAN